MDPNPDDAVEGVIESINITSHGNDAIFVKLINEKNYATRDHTAAETIAALMTLLNLAATKGLPVKIGFGERMQSKTISDLYALNFVELRLPAPPPK